ncbi:FAD:protein FMN transferase, partial [Elusimicrobiota bacterium]
MKNRQQLILPGVNGDMIFRGNSAGDFIAGRFPAVVLVFLLIITFIPAVSYSEVSRHKAVFMGTDIEIVIVDEDKDTVDKAVDAVLKKIEELESVFNDWKEGTPVSKVNRLASMGPVEIPPELYSVIEASLEVSKVTGGAFDITVAAISDMWKFVPGNKKKPSWFKIRKKRKCVGYENIILNKEQSSVFFKKEGTVIGLGGIAKGYVVDIAMQTLANMGVKNAVIKAGGDIRVQGTKEGGIPWEVGIRHPRRDGEAILSIPLTNTSISTSGDYERYFMSGSKRYHHIIDPSTGYPVKGVQSVTVIAADTMTSDVLATSLFVLGPEKGMELIEELKGVEAIIIDDEGYINYSSGFRYK